MSDAKSGASPRAIVDDVLGKSMTREIWTSNYEKMLPISVQDFDVTAVLPAVFYMFRFGHRRGKGKFFETFGGDGASISAKKKAATIERIATMLAGTPSFRGFDDAPERAILGDMLLSFCLENAKRALGRDQPIVRAAPAHYMASWVDLPQSVSNLRFVPEMLVAMLADQKNEYVELSHEGDQTWFAVGQGFQDNLLLKVFHKGVVHDGDLADKRSDKFDEASAVGLDQLLMVRLAKLLGQAPDKVRGKTDGGEKISNQRPIAELAARHFSEDLRQFIVHYANVIPRHSFVEMLESCIAVGLATIFTSVVELLFEWAETGVIRAKRDQRPAALLVDCSNGVDRHLRALAEQSMDDFIRRLERLPVVLMALRLLDHGASFDPKLSKAGIRKRPYATEWLNLLGAILFERRDEAKSVLYEFARKALELAAALEEEYPEAAKLLCDERAHSSSVWRLAEAITSLQGRKNTQNNLTSLFDSSLLANRPNGMGAKRAVIRDVAGGGRKKRDVRSLVFTDAVLDYLVHVGVIPGANKSGYRPLAFAEFLNRLRERHGLFVDVAPPGLTVSNDVLRHNRSVLERRLRDLGLLVGVNDAESMKHLKPRFELSDQ